MNDPITEEKGVRLQKAMAQAGVASRRRSEEMIEAGLVKVNGEVITKLGFCVVSGRDRLEVEGRRVAWDREPTREVWALYKPKNCVTTLDDPEGRPTIRDYYPATKSRLFPVGRLDYDAEGLILLTNDGDLANRIAHPAYSVEKTYLVKVKGLVQPETLDKLRAGPVVEGKKKQPVKARVLHRLTDKCWTEVTLREGVQHHIKKMFLGLGHRVLKIKRYQVGPVALQDMSAGESRLLSGEELEQLVALSHKRKQGKHPTRQPKS